MNQCERVLQYIQDFGSITSIEAACNLGIVDMRKRISELRRGGVNIVSVTETGKNRFGEPTHWNRYSMGCDNG